MPYNESSQRFSQELDDINAGAQKLQNSLNAQRTAALNFAESTYKKEFETQSKYNEKMLKSSLETSKKTLNARQTEANGFVSAWQSAVSQSQANVTSASEGVISKAREQYSSYAEYASDAFQSVMGFVEDTSDKNSTLTDTFVSQWERAFTSTSGKAEGFKGFMQKFFNDLGENCAKNLLDIFKERTSGGPLEGIVSIFTGTLGGMFADGGRPPTGKISVVGERGPELFVPDSSGTIIPNEQIGATSTGVSVNQYFSFQSLDPVTNMKMLEQQKSQIQQWVVEGIRANQNNLRNAVNGA